MDEAIRMGEGKANRRLDLTGMKVGEFLVVLDCTGEKNKNGHYLWNVRCSFKADGQTECGKVVQLPSGRITGGRGTTSCGCYSKSAQFRAKRKRSFIR